MYALSLDHSLSYLLSQCVFCQLEHECAAKSALVFRITKSGEMERMRRMDGMMVHYDALDYAI